MNGWFLIVFATIMLVYAITGAAITLTGWQPEGRYYSAHDDPSPGPNALF